ncbi:MAG: heavy metal translocating P-type ATPase [Reichenbachiella sp.]|uniref:heavy metal translocating P-type ATPase n=1 Tax=Reichenbachiella sp. TaxID=2184521 RepID=UPI0032671EE9
MEKPYHVSGMSCNGCKTHVEEALSQVPGVTNAEVHLKEDKVVVSSQHEISIDGLKNALEGSLYHLDDWSDQSHKKVLAPMPAIKKKPTSGVYYCPMHCEGEKTYNRSGDCPVCGMDLVAQESADGQEDQSYRLLLRKFRVAVAFTVPLFLIAMSDMLPSGIQMDWMPDNFISWVQLLLSIPVVFYATWMFFQRAYTSVVTGNYNMFTLIGIGAGVAWLFSLFSLLFPGLLPDQFRTEAGATHLYFESATVILTLVLLGQVLEARAHRKTSSAVRALLKLTPNEAIRVENGNDIKIHVDDIRLGDVLRVRPGDQVPVDGEIVSGTGFIDESMITGEPLSVEKGTGSKVSAGTLNGKHSFTMMAKKIGSDTLLAQIIAMVNSASRSRAPIQKIADKISGYFVPIVVLISILTFIAWVIFGPDPKFVFAMVNAIAVLIIACPCALGLATPMSVMVGVGKGANLGVLIKDAASLEKMDEVDTLIIDKTGTVTEGKPSVEKVITFNEDLDRVIQLVGSANSQSEHPLAEATLQYAREKGVELLEITDFESATGKGVVAKVQNAMIHVGNEKLMEENQILISTTNKEEAAKYRALGKTVTFVAKEGQIVGAIVISDKIKTTSKGALDELKNLGIEIIMMTGDNALSAGVVAKSLGLESVIAECLPEDKMNKVRELQASGRVVAMAGDGINDAPALALSDVGIAMGTGTDVAIESASIALVQGDLNGILKAKKLSHQVLRNIKQNLFFALIYNGLGVPLAAGVLFPFFGILLSPMIAALAMSFSSVSVITNALRLRAIKI